MSIPFYRRLGDRKQNPLIRFVESLKSIWSMEDVDDDKIDICACYDATTIVLQKRLTLSIVENDDFHST